MEFYEGWLCMSVPKWCSLHFCSDRNGKIKVTILLNFVAFLFQVKILLDNRSKIVPLTLVTVQVVETLQLKKWFMLLLSAYKGKGHVQ